MYEVSKVEFVYNSGKISDRTISHPHIRFVLWDGTITLLDQKFVHSLYEDSSGKLWMKRRFEKLSRIEQQDILKAFERFDTFAEWKLPL